MEISFNFDRLYGGNDPDYVMALKVVSERVHASKERAHRAAEASGS